MGEEALRRIMLIDTNVLIDYFRKKEPAVNYLDNLGQEFKLSAVTVAELYAGVRKGKEEKELNAFIAVTKIIPIDKQMAIQAGQYLRQYRQSHGVGFGDGLIAATANIQGLTLVTLNTKHFPMVKDILKPY